MFATTFKFRLSAVSALVAAVILSGCQSAPAPSGVVVPATAQEVPGPLGQAVRSASRALGEHDYKAANLALNGALSRDPRNPVLNFINGLVYHLRTRAGETDLFDLAETGYLIALESQHDLTAAAVQLGYLYQENRRYEKAQRAALYALDLEPENAEATGILAASSYHAADMGMALWAVEQRRKLAPGDRLTNRMTPLVYSANGLDAEAEQALELVDPRDRPTLNRRTRQWRELRLASLEDVPVPPGQQLAGSAIDFSAPPPPMAAPRAEVTGDSEPISDQGASAYAWSDCRQQLTSSNSSLSPYGSYGGGSSGGDETTALTALPSPCKGRPLPKMAVVDVVMLRTDDNSTTSRGVNLLDNLNVFIQQSIQRERSFGTSPSTKQSTISSYIGLGSSVGGGLAYSLNIANASGQRADILARPSLLVLDRQPAQFFSGSNVTVAMISAQGGGNIQDKPVGVSLSVTPTFVDDDTMLLSVKAARSFFETTAPSATFQQSVQTSRNMVSASAKLKFNETLVLSGLSEREVSSVSSGVPVLRDIPGLQYLFNRETTLDFTKSVVILLTPRRVSTYGELLETAYISHEGSPELVKRAHAKAVKEMGGVWPNLKAALQHMERNKLYAGVRNGDMHLEKWDDTSGIERRVSDALKLLYY